MLDASTASPAARPRPRSPTTSSKPLRIVVILLVAWIARAHLRRLIDPPDREATSERGGVETIGKLRRRTGVSLLDTSPVPSVRRALRAETIGAVLRSIVSVADLGDRGRS